MYPSPHIPALSTLKQPPLHLSDWRRGSSMGGWTQRNEPCSPGSDLGPAGQGILGVLGTQREHRSERTHLTGPTDSSFFRELWGWRRIRGASRVMAQSKHQGWQD